MMHPNGLIAGYHSSGYLFRVCWALPGTLAHIQAIHILTLADARTSCFLGADVWEDGTCTLHFEN